MYIEVYSKTGAAHIQAGLPCQDHYYRITDEDRQTIVICDGIQEIGGLAAKVVSQTLAEELHHADYLKATVRTIRGRLYLFLQDKLNAYAKENDLDIEKLATTIMAISVNCHTGEALMIHLGDGIILSNCFAYPVSLPDNRIDRYMS